MQNHTERREFCKGRDVIEIMNFAEKEKEMAASMQQIIEKAREELSKVTGLELSTTLGAVKEEKGWKVTLEMVEKHSIPDQMDILAVYEVIVDNNGNVIEFNRTRLRKRVDTEVVAVE